MTDASPQECDLRCIQDLDTVVKEAAHSHSAAAKGKLHYFLQEGELLLPA
jgi:hypothetical protein